MSHPSRRRRVGRVAAAATVAGLAVASLSGLAAATPTGALFTSTASAGPADFGTRVACSAGTGYPASVVALNPTFYYRFGESNAPYPTTVADSSGNGNTGAVTPTGSAALDPAFGTPSPLWCDSTDALSSPAVGGGVDPAGAVAWPVRHAAPDTFTLMSWVTVPNGLATGGRVLGFGDTASNLSGDYDRILFVDDSGRAEFGIFDGGVETISSPLPINDGKPHQLAASLGPAGGRLYVDGALVASAPAWTTAYTYPTGGYWRIGWDNLGGWGAVTDNGLDGTIDEVAVFEGQELTPAEVSGTYATNHW